MKKVIIILALIVALCVPTNTYAASIPTTYGELLNMVGLISGTDKGLEEGKTLSRQQMVAILNRISPLQTYYKSYVAPETPSFSDVPKTHWAYKDIEYAKEMGITSGIGGGKFGIDQLITANQAAQFFSNILGYGDFDGTMSYKEAYVEVGKRLGISVSSPTVNANSHLLRGQVFKMMVEALKCVDPDGQVRAEMILTDDSKLQTFESFMNKVSLHSESSSTIIKTISFDVLSKDLLEAFDAQFKVDLEVAKNVDSPSKEYNILLNQANFINASVERTIQQYLINQNFKETTLDVFQEALTHITDYHVSITPYLSDTEVYLSPYYHFPKVENYDNKFILVDIIESSEGFTDVAGEILGIYESNTSNARVILTIFEDYDYIKEETINGYIAMIFTPNGDLVNSILITSMGSANLK